MIRAYHGDDQVALQEAFAKDLGQWCGGDSLAKEVIHLEECEPARAGAVVLEACQTQSLFAEQRAVVVYEAERFPADAEDALAKWIADPTPGTALFLVFGKWDGRSKLAKLLSAVQGAVRAFEAPKSWEMAKAVAAVAEQNGFRVSPDVAERISDLLGADIDRVRIEFLKLASYFAPKLAAARGPLALTREMVEETVVEQSEGDLFRFADLFVAKDPQAPHALRQMLERGGIPIVINGALFNAVARTLHGALMHAIGVPDAEIAAAMGISPGRLHHRKKLFRARPIREFERLVVRLEEIESLLKSGGLTGVRDYELAVLPLMANPRKGN